MSNAVLTVIGLCLTALYHILMYLPGAPEAARGFALCGNVVIYFVFVKLLLDDGARSTLCKRLYAVSVITAFVNSTLSALLMQKIGTLIGTVPGNIYTALLHGAMLISMLDSTRLNPKRRAKYICGYVIWQIVFGLVFIQARLFYSWLVPASTATLCVLSFADGSLPLTGLMLLFYFCGDSKKRLAVSYPLYIIVWALLDQLHPVGALLTVLTERHPEIAVYGVIQGIMYLAENGSDPLSEILAEEWMVPVLRVSGLWNLMLLPALPVLLLWKEKKCRDLRMTFLKVYPAIVYVPYLISVLYFAKQMAF